MNKWLLPSFIAIIAVSLLAFIGCSGGRAGSNEDGGDNSVVTVSTMEIKGKFNFGNSSTAKDDPENSKISRTISRLPVPANPTAILNDIKTKSAVATSPINANGYFAFYGDFRNLTLSISIASTDTEIIIGSVPSNMPLNSRILVSYPYDATGGFDEYAVITSNIIKSKNLVDNIKIDQLYSAKSLWDMVETFKPQIQAYITANPSKKLSTVVTETADGNSAATVAITSKINLPAGAFDHFYITSDSPQYAGSAITLTVYAQDASGNTVSSYTGSGSLIISNPVGTVSWTGNGLTNTGNGSASYSYTTFNRGVASVKVVNTSTDTSKTFTITDSSTGKYSSTALTWNVDTSKIFDHFSITSTSPQSMNSFITLTVIAKNSAGGTLSSYSGSGTLSLASPTGTITWSGTGLTPSSNGTANYSSSAFVNGIASLQLKSSSAETSKTLTITDSLSGKTATVSLSWLNDIIDHFSITSITSPQVAGVAFSMTVTAKNSSGETITTFSSTASIGDSTNTISPTSTGAFSGGSWTGNVTITKASDNVKINVVANSQTYSSNQFIVNRGAPSKLFVYQQPSSTSTAGALIQQQPKAGVCDNYGNVDTSDNKTVITASRGSSGTSTLRGTLSAKVVNGIATFTDLYYNKAEDIKISFSADTSLPATESDNIRVIPEALDHFVFSLSSPQSGDGSAFVNTNTLAAVDTFENLVTSFNAALNNVTVEVSVGNEGTILGLGSDNKNVLNQSFDFVNGVANLTGKLKFLTLYKGTRKFSASIGNMKVTSNDVVFNTVYVPNHFEVIAKTYDTANDPKTYPLGFKENSQTEEGGYFELTVTAKDSNNSIIQNYSNGGTLSISPSPAGVVTWEGRGIIDSGNTAANNNAIYSAYVSFSGGFAKFYIRNTRACAAKITLTDYYDKNMTGEVSVTWIAENVPSGLVFEGENSKGFRKYSTVRDNTVKLIKIPASNFDIGDGFTNEGQWAGMVNMKYEIRMSTYYIGETPITNEQFNRWFTSDGCPGVYGKWFQNKGLDKYGDHPAVYVNYLDTHSYSYWLMTGVQSPAGSSDITYAKFLPTEAQYEKAMRGAKLYGVGNNADEKTWPWGNVMDTSKCNEYTVYTTDERPLGDNSPFHGTTPVTKYPEQGYYGLRDISGNVFELVRDFWIEQLEYDSNTIDPYNSTNSGLLIIKGGSWEIKRGYHCSFRESRENYSDFSFENVGFRVAVQPKYNY